MDKIDRLLKDANRLNPEESVYLAFIEENSARDIELRVQYCKGKLGSKSFSFTRQEDTIHKTVEEAENHLNCLPQANDIRILHIHWV